jgi:type II secretory pathway pseudopilin PulG
MRNPRAGITLIEVLIAVSLLSLLSVGMLIAMRLGFNTMAKTDAHLVQNRTVVNVRQIVENEIAGFIPTFASWQPKPQVFYTANFRQFEPNIMRFVTAYSLKDAWRGRTQISVLQVIPGENGAGVRLILNEIPYNGPAQAGLMIVGQEPDPATGMARTFYTDVPAGSQSFVLADKLRYCRFTYLEPRPEPPFRIWRPEWILPRLPLGIRLDMEPLSNAPAELHMSIITVPFPINPTKEAGYNDGP